MVGAAANGRGSESDETGAPGTAAEPAVPFSCLARRPRHPALRAAPLPVRPLGPRRASATLGRAGLGPVRWMDLHLADVTLLLARTPAVLDAWLRGLPPSWTLHDEGPGTWSPFEIVGHLIHGERADWIPRARSILEEDGVFAPFDRFAQREASRGKALEELLDTFTGLRAASLETLRGWRLGPAELARPGTHPAFGRVTLGELLATWVTHDQDHLAQVARVLAHRQREAVGPWRAYLRIVGGG